jgi:S-methylmethionine-dependent homocysteine/selenocysteine methylase
MDFVERLRTSSVMLTAGAIDTRLKHEYGLPTPAQSAFVHLFSLEGRAALTKMYSSYMEVAAEHDMPMLVHTVTWRAHPDAITRQGFDKPGDLQRINIKAAEFLLSLRREIGAEKNVYIAGDMGPRVDGYNPAGAPDAATAESYNRDQAAILAESGVDLLIAGTIASVGELLGLSRALAATELPYILAPVITPSGAMPDGTPMAEVVARIDTGACRPPVQFIINCVHPSHFAEAAAGVAWPTSERVNGLQGNASSLSLQERDTLEHIDGSEPEEFAELMAGLHAKGLKIVGGCCGTNPDHLHALARRLKVRQSH